jgi:hypothetical protein
MDIKQEFKALILSLNPQGSYKYVSQEEAEQLSNTLLALHQRALVEELELIPYEPLSVTSDYIQEKLAELRKTL